jgi:hypothetical protein
MGRNARERAKRRAAQKMPPVLILWGIPGAGKSHFARWLAQKRGFTHVEADANGTSQLEQAWRASYTIASPQAFLQAVRTHRRPVVLEFGLWATPRNIQLLATLRAQAANVWWFDGDRDAARQAWRAENAHSNRLFAEEKWDEVVSAMDDHWPLIVKVFGSNRVRTVEAGPVHIAPEAAFAAIFPSG